jgi:FAD/FMN-containing dehydrogenase
VVLVNASGKLVTLARGKDEHFTAAVVGLGAPGIVTRVTLDLQPTFQVAQSVYENLPFDRLKDHFDGRTADWSETLFVDTMRTLRILCAAHQLGHVLMGENGEKINLLDRAATQALATAKYIVFDGTSEHTYDVRGRTAHELQILR